MKATMIENSKAKRPKCFSSKPPSALQKFGTYYKDCRTSIMVVVIVIIMNGDDKDVFCEDSST